MQTFIKLIFTAALPLLFCQQAMAHGEYQTKTACTWGWQYKVKARTNHLALGISSQTTQSCACCGFGSGLTASASNHCANQTSKYCCGTLTFTGSVFCHSGHTSRGFGLSQLTSHLIPMTASPNNNSEESNLIIREVQINRSGYTININGYIEVSGKKLTSSLELIAWAPRHGIAEDTTIDASEIVSSGAVRVFNGQLILEGIFAGDNIQFAEVSNKVWRATFTNFNKTILAPANVNGDSIVYVLRSDGQVEEEALRQSALDETTADSDVKFDLFPNPAASDITITYTLPSDESVTMNIFDEQGALVATLSQNQAGKDKQYEVKINVGELNLQSGVYFVSLELAEQTYLKKLIIAK
ncbi:MAG: T9SS type A sorting domain-containing protein [Bacteroidota bacterium]